MLDLRRLLARVRWAGVGRSGKQPRASGLGRVLSDPLLAGYPLENVTVLADGDATRDNLVRRG